MNAQKETQEEKREAVVNLENNFAFETKNFRQFSHRDCEFFPCHKDVPIETYNCLFCFCPLYLLKERCGGQFKYLENGVKDCSGCTIPHDVDSYDKIMSKMELVISTARKNNR